MELMAVGKFIFELSYHGTGGGAVSYHISPFA